MTIYIERRPKGNCWLKQLHLFQTGQFVIQRMTLSLAGAALIKSFRFVVLDMFNPARKNAPNASLTPVGFIHRKRNRAVHQQSGHEPLHTPNHSSWSILLSASTSSRLYRATAKYYDDLLHTTVKRTWSNKINIMLLERHQNMGKKKKINEKKRRTALLKPVPWLSFTSESLFWVARTAIETNKIKHLRLGDLIWLASSASV